MSNTHDTRSSYPPRPIHSASPGNLTYDSEATLASSEIYDQQQSDHKLDSRESFRQIPTGPVKTAGVARDIGARTPSPTPSEAEELSRSGAFDWNRLKHWRFWIRTEWTWYYVIAIAIATTIALITFFHNKIVDFLTPAANWMHRLPAGWLIPIAILFIISFPPLFGHEIIAVLCGLVWGLWVGFGIVAAGTFLGEVGNFYAFKWCCRARGEKLERTNLSYACLANVIRNGGFKVALVARLSAIPGHFTTAVFSTCGMGIITFSIAAILSLPKQFITVYLGVVLEQSASGTPTSSKDNIIKWVVIGITTLITIWALWYIYHAMGKAKVQVIYERRKARQVKLSSPYALQETSSSSALNTLNCCSQVELHIPVNRRPFDQHANFDSDSSSEPYQKWDEHGNAIGWVGDPNLVFAPKPSRAAGYTLPQSETLEAESPVGRSGTGQYRLPSEDIGYRYPTSEIMRGGRVILRQQSDDSAESVAWETGHRQLGHHVPEHDIEVQRVGHSPPPTDQYELTGPTNRPTKPQTRSSESQFSYIPSMQVTQSDPSPYRSPTTTPRPNSSRPMAPSVSLPIPSTRQYDDSPQSYNSPTLPSMYDRTSPHSTPAVPYLQPSLQRPQEPYSGYQKSLSSQLAGNGHSPPPRSYYADAN